MCSQILENKVIHKIQKTILLIQYTKMGMVLQLVPISVQGTITTFAYVI